MIKYETDPVKIRKISFKKIKESVSLVHLNKIEQKIAIEMIQASGDLSILENLRFSKQAVETGLEALDDDHELYCDTDGVICNLKPKYLKNEPLCFINKANVISQAKSNKKTRSMTAVDLWKKHLSGSIVIIGSEPTALFRLIEILEEQDKEHDDYNLPKLIIVMPVGFTGAIEAKKYLWENRKKLKVPCITLLGTRGGNDLASTVMNCLLKIHSEKKTS